MIETIEIKKKYLQLINNQKYNPYILCTTSLLFFIPFIYAIEKKLYLYSFFIALMGLLSINHWWKPEYGVNRYIDIVYARCSFMLSLIIFLIYVDCSYNIIASAIIISFTLYNYKLSTENFINGNNKWIYHHALFHIGAVAQQTLIISHIL